MEVACDNCGTVFTPDLKEVETKNGNTKTIFTCPKCQHEYLAFVTNESIRGKQKGIRKLRKQVQTALKTGDRSKARKLLEETDRIQEEMSIEMSELKET